MTNTFILDGIKVQLQAPDLDKDGVTGGIERVSQDRGIQPIVQPTELGDTLKNLNDDILDPTTRMSNIDMRTRLGWSEIPSLLCIDSLVSFKFLPTGCLMLTRQKKRLNVSLQGKGRDDIVNIVAGKRDQEAQAAGGGFFQGLKDRIGIGGGK